MHYIIYGIRQCNTMKKAFSWLDAHQIAYEFHDYKKAGISEEKLQSWIRQLGWEALINRKGTTWRKLSDSEKEQVKDAASAIAALQQKTSMIKRPLIEKNGKVILLGFDEKSYDEKLL